MKLITILILAFMSSMAIADTTLATNMSQMESGLTNVQKGFLYNNPTQIKEGVAEIHTSNLLFHTY
jgi:hypothetical protein